MEIQEFSFKELYSARLKATYPIEVAGNLIEAGEVIADFDKIEIANIQEIKSIVVAQGGKFNEPQIIWNTPKEININFIQGVFSKTQFAIMNNLKYLQPIENHKELIGEREIKETNDSGEIWLKYVPTCDVYVYDAITGKKFLKWDDPSKPIIDYWIWKGENIIQIVSEEVSERELIIDYCFTYCDATSILKVGKEFTNGFLWLEGKTRVQDDETGLVKTGILRIPKLKLMSDLSIKVGKQANPQVGNFYAKAYPTGNQGSKEVMRMIFLENDIDSDI